MILGNRSGFWDGFRNGCTLIAARGWPVGGRGQADCRAKSTLRGESRVFRGGLGGTMSRNKLPETVDCNRSVTLAANGTRIRLV